MIIQPQHSSVSSRYARPALISKAGQIRHNDGSLTPWLIFLTSSVPHGDATNIIFLLKEVGVHICLCKCMRR